MIPFKEKSTNKYWDEANNTFAKLAETTFAIVQRESMVYPGVMIGTPVKVLTVDVPTASFRNANLPYVKVLVELPNGETRNISGDVLEISEKKLFDKFQKLFKSVVFVQYPMIEKNIG